MSDAPDSPPDKVAWAITDELDLHLFRPKEVPSVTREYLRECRIQGISPVRIIHGKGKGNLRRTVQSILDKSPLVSCWELCGQGHGSWGATRAYLDLEAPIPD